MIRSRSTQGFTLIELLLVLAIIGIIAGIAIPSFMGQRKRARVIGDAQSNARTLQMAVATTLSELTVLPKGVTQKWTAAGVYEPAATSWAPLFTPKGNSKMDYQVTSDATGLGYVVIVTDPAAANHEVLRLDDKGVLTLDAVYNK